jgi:hypothetical protein
VWAPFKMKKTAEKHRQKRRFKIGKIKRNRRSSLRYFVFILGKSLSTGVTKCRKTPMSAIQPHNQRHGRCPRVPRHRCPATRPVGLRQMMAVRTLALGGGVGRGGVGGRCCWVGGVHEARGQGGQSHRQRACRAEGAQQHQSCPSMRLARRPTRGGGALVACPQQQQGAEKGGCFTRFGALWGV